MRAPAAVRDRTRVFLAEYVGALPPGRVIAVSVRTAARMSAGEQSELRFLQVWEASVRRQLVEEVALDLARRTN